MVSRLYKGSLPKFVKGGNTGTTMVGPRWPPGVQILVLGGQLGFIAPCCGVRGEMRLAKLIKGNGCRGRCVISSDRHRGGDVASHVGGVGGASEIEAAVQTLG